MADKEDDASTSQSLIRRLFSEIEIGAGKKNCAAAGDDAYSRMRRAFFTTDDGRLDGRLRRIRQLARLARFYEKLNQTNGIGAIYTPAWMATLMARRALAAKLMTTLSVNQAQIEALFRNEKIGRNNTSVARSRLTCDAPDLIRSLIITDPACGGGALLLAVAQCATDLCESGKLDDKCWRRAFLKNLSGFDIDALAVEITRARLAAWAGVDRNDPTLANIICRDALTDGVESCYADVCIMNPPYVPTYSRRSDPRVVTTVNRYAATHQLTGRLNLFGCFMHRALDIIHPDGVACAIVPDTFASATAYEPLRSAWRQRFNQTHWLSISDSVFDAQVGSVVVTAVCKNTSARQLQADDLMGVSPVQLRRRVPAIAADGRLLIFRTELEQQIWQAVQIQSCRFDEFVRSRDGVNTGPRSIRDLLLDPKHVGPTVMPLVEGEDIAPQGFRLNHDCRRIDYNPDLIDAAARRAGASLRDPEIFAQPKVLTRQTADTLIAAVEPQGGIVALNSVHCHQLVDAPDELLWGLCAWLNAPLVRLYYALDGGEQRKVLPQVRIAWLRKLPVPANFDVLLHELAPISRCITECADGKPPQNALDRLHKITCAAAGLAERADDVLAAYHERFPRFAANSAASISNRDASAA